MSVGLIPWWAFISRAQRFTFPSSAVISRRPAGLPFASAAAFPARGAFASQLVALQLGEG